MAIKKKQKTIKTLIIRNFIMIITTIIFVLLLYLLLINRGYQSGFILPANSEEKRVEALINNIKINGEAAIQASDSFVSFDKNLNQIKTQNIRNIIVEQSKLYLESSYNRENQNLYFQVVEKDGITYVFNYGLTSRFANPLLNTIIPNTEIFFFSVGLVLVVVIVGVFSTRLGRRLNSNFKQVEETTKQIREENLEFTIEKSDIVEFENLLDSLNLLKDQLKQSLEKQWVLEEGKKGNWPH